MSTYTANKGTAANTRGTVSTSRKLVFIAILGAISFVLMLINFSVPFAPSFLKFDIAELPGLFAGFFLGPLAGFGVVVIKLLLKIAIQGSETAFVGEFSNLVSSTLFVVLAAWIYKVDRTKKGAVIAMAASTVAVSILAIFLNAYIMFPLYSRLYGMPMEAIIGMGTAINPRINSLITMMLFSILPFNLVKHLVTSLITFWCTNAQATSFAGFCTTEDKGPGCHRMTSRALSLSFFSHFKERIQHTKNGCNHNRCNRDDRAAQICHALGVVGEGKD